MTNIKFHPDLRAQTDPINEATGDHDCARRWSFTSTTKVGCALQRSILTAVSATVLATMLLGVSPAHAGITNDTFLVPQRSITAPAGFTGICAKYNWVCAPSAVRNLSLNETLRLAKRINRQVNRQVRQIEDQTQYCREELWALPTHRGGDCEDLVLLKKKMLLEHGVPSENLLIATVLDHKLRSHAVLVLRTASGDLVLDN